MSKRPLFSYSIDQLECLFKEASEDSKRLYLLLGELKHRHTDRAQGLGRKVEKLLEARGDGSGKRVSTVATEVKRGRPEDASVLSRVPVRSELVPGVAPTADADSQIELTLDRGPEAEETRATPSDISRARYGDPGEAGSARDRLGEGMLRGRQKLRPRDKVFRAKETMPGGSAMDEVEGQIELTETQQRLIDLVDYVRHMVQLGEKPVFALKEYRQLIFHEAEFKGRIGIAHDVPDEDGGAWARIERLKRNDPPGVPEAIRDWITVGRDPFKTPAVNTLHPTTLPKAEAESLVAKGTLDREDVQPALNDGLGERRDVVFRLERLPHIKQAVDNYLSGPWVRWAEAEKPRRETIDIYDKLFALHQVLESHGTADALELVWGIGHVRWRSAGGEVDHPLIEQLVETEIDPRNGSLSIQPRAAEPQMAIKPYLAMDNAGAEDLLKFGRDFFGQATIYPDREELSPFQRSTFEPVLRQAVTRLDAGGRYYPDECPDINDRKVPPASPHLVITDTWVIYVRRRSDNFYLADLEQLTAAIRFCKELPGPAKALVTKPLDERRGEPILPGIGGFDGGIAPPVPINDSSSQDFFFPKPFNEDQIAIIERLEEADGMVVQGPPGTGKTHTIANIICHYLATGKRVLVTSKGEAALAVLRDHIPEGIRDLAISLLTSEREGLKQLERAVNLLASTAARMNAAQLQRDILAGQQRIIDLKRKQARIERELHAWAEKHLKRVDEGRLTMDLAREVIEGRGQHRWFADRPMPGNPFSPRFTDEDIAAAREARKRLGRDLCYLGASLPSLADLPDTATIGAIHEDLVNTARLEEQAVQRRVPVLSMMLPHAIDRAQALLQAVEATVASFTMMEDTPWLRRVFDIWRRNGPDAPKIRLFNDLLQVVERIARARAIIVNSPVFLPTGAHHNPALCEAVARAAEGRMPFGVLPLGKGDAKALFREIRIEGRPPAAPQEWARVTAYIAWRKEISAFVARWAVIAADYELPPVADEGDATGLWVTGLREKLDRAADVLVSNLPVIRAELPALFPYGIDVEATLESKAEAQRVAEFIRINLAKHRLGSSRNRITALNERLAASSGDIATRLRQFCMEQIGDPSLSVHELTDRWQVLCQALRGLQDLRPAMQTLERVAAAVEESGAPAWAGALRTESVTGIDDPWTPSNWRESWDWAALDGYLHEIDGRERLHALAREADECEKDLWRTFAQVVKLRTYAGLKQNITPLVDSALTVFTTALRNIGRGTGVRTPRLRGDARAAMEKCYSAVPCWIMPTWRVSENLPAQLGSFDLVIVDEASQSDITTLPALMRGKKVLVVGDDKQVSPTAAFIEERKLLQLRHNYLEQQPFSPLLLPGNSLYDLAKAAYPGTHIMLHEHFRCVEPIIRFSFQFYTEEIVPLRIPKASERLDPPLIDVYVTDGFKDKRQINVPEAAAIVDEIARVVEDPAYARRSIGVVSLIGAKQAQYIQAHLLERIGEDAYFAHNIVCRDAATFQGNERDIMFVSMVECPQTKSAKTALLFQQRFNVALSRARDRMYLFRSVTEEMLRPDDLKAKVIRHFKSPMGTARRTVDDLRELCESGFEREVFDRLVALDYRVTPQVRVGAYSIDLVVEGAEDRRLAIELDGDQYHTPERWAEDLARQRALERMGWRFWRCWGSSFILDADGCMADLCSALRQMGIEPIGGGATVTVYTEHRVVGPQVMQPVAGTEAAGEQVAAVTAAPAVMYGSVPANQSPEDTPIEASLRPEVIDEEFVVQPGDRVLISYNDEPSRQHTLTLSTARHDPDMLIIKASEPLAQALMGYGEDDEVEIPAGGGTRTVTVLKIERPVPGDRHQAV